MRRLFLCRSRAPVPSYPVILSDAKGLRLPSLLLTANRLSLIAYC